MKIAESEPSVTEVLIEGPELDAFLREEYDNFRQCGWRVRMRHWFGYITPDKIYEATVSRLVTKDSYWIDVGAGRNVFPHNRLLSRTLARRARHFVGVDPSENIETNAQLGEQAQCTIEEFQSNLSFDLATLRMVAEHIAEPERTLEALSRLIRPGGKVVIYTPNRWAPVSIAARMTPLSWHRTLAKVLWGAKQEDVFPTTYRMNTRSHLGELFGSAGFKEASFAHLDDCTAFQRFKIGCFAELTLWRFLRALNIRYPENNLLGVYELDGG